MTEKIEDCERAGIVRKIDVLNIIKQFKIPEFYSDKKDLVSLHQYCTEELAKGADSTVVYYDGDPAELRCLMLQTLAQKENLLAFGTEAVFMDGTHDVIYRNKHKLVNLMTIDQFGKGLSH